MNHKLPICVVITCSVLVMAGVMANPQTNGELMVTNTNYITLVHANPSKAYTPGAYGRVKNASMFICWREWDGEIRLGGVAKSLSTPINFTEDYFAGEIEGNNGSANQEHLMFGPGTTNIIVKSNYVGTIACEKEPLVTRTTNGWTITFTKK